MAGRYGVCAYQRSFRATLAPQKSLSHFLPKYKMLLRNFRSGLSGPHFSDSAARQDSQDKATVNCCNQNDSEKLRKESFEVGSVLDYFDLSPSLESLEQWKSKLVSTMLVYPNFVSKEEEENLMKEIEPYISRLHYESSHWDDAIHEYRETERSRWNKKNEVIINRIRNLAFPPGVPQLKLVHILDLAKKGVIKPHIDSVRFCGNTIAGISLLSDSIMKLKHDVQKEFFCDVYLPRYSLYVMKDFARYEFTHEILGETESMFKTKHISRDRRISIICRNEPEEDSNTPGPIFKALKE